VAGRRQVQHGIPHGWRNVVSGPQVTTFDHDGTEVRVGWHRARDGYLLADPELEAGPAVARVSRADGGWQVLVDHDGVTYPFEVFVTGDRVDVEGPSGHVSLTRKPRFVDPADQVAEGSLLAPMPGAVVGVHAAIGEPVSGGQPVLVLEAMKMQHTIAAPYDGVLEELPVHVGDQVSAGDVLAVVSKTSTHDPEGEPA
jgi:propionyl-CoA carboxylase alpha chain